MMGIKYIVSVEITEHDEEADSYEEMGIPVVIDEVDSLGYAKTIQDKVRDLLREIKNNPIKEVSDG